MIEKLVRARVERLQDRLRIDPDDPHPVLRSRDHRGDRGAVRFVLVAHGRLHVERHRVRARGELRVREVEAGVDIGDRHTCRRRDDGVRADRRDPPLLGRERVAGGPGSQGGSRPKCPVRLDGAQRVQALHARDRLRAARPAEEPDA